MTEETELALLFYNCAILLHLALSFLLIFQYYVTRIYDGVDRRRNYEAYFLWGEDEVDCLHGENTVQAPDLSSPPL